MNFKYPTLTPRRAPTPDPIRNYHHFVGRQGRDSEASHQVGRPVDADEAAVDCVDRGYVVDEHHGPGAVAADVEPERWALPEDAPLAGVPSVELALAVAQAAEKRAGALLAENVAVRFAQRPDGLLDGQGEAARDAAEELVATIDEFFGSETVGSPGLPA